VIVSCMRKSPVNSPTDPNPTYVHYILMTTGFRSGTDIHSHSHKHVTVIYQNPVPSELGAHEICWISGSLIAFFFLFLSFFSFFFLV
jgi:hypothetical protein